MPRTPQTITVLRTDLGGDPAATRWAGGIFARAGIPVAERGNFVIYGSILRTLWQREQVGDLNLARPIGVGTEQVIVPSDGGQTIPISLAPHPSTPEAIVRRADFTICQGAYQHPWLYHSEAFRVDVQARVLCTATLTPSTVEASLLRAIKFAARGFRLTARTLQDLVRAIPAGNCTLPAEELRRHSAGRVLAG